MLLPIKTIAGETVGEIELNESVFAAPVNTSLMHQTLVRQLANARLGTHKTKTRKEVAGGGRKPWRQKGTGRARQGSTRAPNWVGGGTVFGPQPRKYTKALPKKMQRAALRSALSVKASSEQIIVLDELTMETPRTKDMIAILNNLELAGQRVLLVDSTKNLTVQRSAHNLPNVKTLLSGYINIRDLLGYDIIVLSQEAIMHIEDWLGSPSTNEDEALSADSAPMMPEADVDDVVSNDSSEQESDLDDGGEE